MLKVCILGYGGIARSHRKGYEILANEGAPVQLTALCDIDEKQFENEVSINNSSDSAFKIRCNTYTDLDKMLETEKPDIVDICLPTYLHCEYAQRLLLAGYNVMSEKPMGLNSEQCQKMIEAQKKSGKHLMIGMCLRFDNYYLELKKMIDDKRYGKVKTAFFTRLSSLPQWGFDGWFRDYNRAGGVALDMHIHDVDMIRFLFGEPKAVTATVNDGEVKCETVCSNFIYDDKLVNAVGDWGMASGTKFASGYRVNFENATVVCEGGKIFVTPSGEKKFEHEFERNNHMAGEIGFFTDTVLGSAVNEKNKPEDAAKSVELVEKIMESAENGGKLVCI